MESVLFDVKGEKKKRGNIKQLRSMNELQKCFFSITLPTKMISYFNDRVILIYMSSFVIFYYPDILYIFQK